MEVRRLDIIPIVHGEVDLGSVAAALRAGMGEAAWSARQRAIEGFWAAVAGWAGGVEAPGLRVYQDGLPDDVDPTPIVRALAERGSPNHRVLMGMIDRGAVVMGTEDPGLLRAEYEMAMEAAAAVEKGRMPDPRHTARARALLERRDRFIAGRIGATLEAGGRGALLIGVLHDVAGYLPDDMTVSYPLGRPKAVTRAG